ncbi:ABC transporter ATP-binding protein, partial [Streptomyces sp. NPDC059018]
GRGHGPPLIQRAPGCVGHPQLPPRRGATPPPPPRAGGPAATCHLDPAAEARAERAFADRPGTLLVIAHRLSSARRADRVLVLDGVTATAGRHEELLERSETYRDLVGHWQA